MLFDCLQMIHSYVSQNVGIQSTLKLPLNTPFHKSNFILARKIFKFFWV